MRPLFVPVAGALLLCGPGPAAASPADAVRAGDMDRMITEIIDLYEGEGLSWNHGIEWTIGPFTTTYWYYSHMTDEIVVGAVPRDDEIDAYWQTWSEVLTDGNFLPGDFFASEAEARELAHYNQYVLATHESAHAITYRYDFAHLERHDYSVNCREFYADRLTVAILNAQASTDADMARWRERYLELVMAMGETIPEQYRYHIADFATLDANCAMLDVAQPTPETMQPYASAYFERYRVLLEADLPPVAEVFDAHLGRYLDETLARYPLDPERGNYEVVTTGTMKRAGLGGGASEEDGSQAAAFDPDGRLWFALLRYDGEAKTIEVRFGTEADPAEVVVAAWPFVEREALALELAALAVASPNEFFLSLDHWEEPEAGAALPVVTWLHAYRSDGQWTMELLARLEEAGQGTVLRKPGGAVHFLVTPDQPSGEDSDNWRGFAIDPATGETIWEGALASRFDFPIAVDAEGRLYEEIGNLLWRSTPEGRDTVLIGDSLRGLRDGSGQVAEINAIEVMQWFADGTARMVDVSDNREGWVLRDVRPVEAGQANGE